MVLVCNNLTHYWAARFLPRDNCWLFTVFLPANLRESSLIKEKIRVKSARANFLFFCLTAIFRPLRNEPDINSLTFLRKSFTSLRLFLRLRHKLHNRKRRRNNSCVFLRIARLWGRVWLGGRGLWAWCCYEVTTAFSSHFLPLFLILHYYLFCNEFDGTATDGSKIRIRIPNCRDFVSAKSGRISGFVFASV